MFKRWLPKPRRSALILGPRRAGKSSYLKNNFKDFQYLTLDDFDIFDLSQKDPKALFHGRDKIIIDEIQRVPKLTIAAKFAIDEEQKTVMMSGSSRIGLLDASADTMAGRIDILEMPPACWGENLEEPTHKIFEEEPSSLQLKEAGREFENFLKYGGFPEVLSKNTNQEKEDILKNYKTTYFTRDLSQLSNIENISGLRAVLNHYARCIGSITQVAHFQNEANLSHVTAKKYLNSIYQSGLGFTLLGYHHGPTKKYIKGAKSYFCDTGMIHALGMPCSFGQIIQNFVISEIEKRRKLGFRQTDQFYFYQSSSGFEIDLIFEEGENLYAVEIKATKRPSRKDVRHLKEFIEQDPDRRKGFLFYMGEEYNFIDGIKILPIASLYRGC